MYEEDATTLEPGCWLNDAIIAYHLELFLSKHQLSQPRMVILEPTTVFTAVMVGDPGQLREMLSVSRSAGAVPLTQQLLDADIVIMPVSNNEDAASAGGGSHWSLLVFRRRTGVDDAAGRFEHYDSCSNANGPNARNVMAAIAPLLFPTGMQPQRMQLVRMTTPQQANGYDCGVYTLAISEIICAAPVDDGATSSDTVTAAVRSLTPEAVTAKRAAWLEEVRQAMKYGPTQGPTK